MSKTLDLRKVKADAETAAETTPAKSNSPVIPRDIEFTVNYNAPDGESYSADLTSRVCDGNGRTLRNRVLASLLNGLSRQAVGEDEYIRYEALARVSTQLVDMPEWMNTWVSQDDELLANINAVLMEHEYRFFRGNTPQGEGGERLARIRVDSPLLKGPGTP